MKIIKRNSTILFVCCALLTFIFSCENPLDPERPTTWALVWADEFEGAAAQSPDSLNWVFDIGTGPNNDGWGNAELQYYSDRPENVSLDGEGNLAITARRESFGGQPFTSARITTKGLFDQAYGRFEARLKMPWGPGIWPAFWLLGSDIDENPWPQSGEIDIMEYRGQEPHFIHATVHGPGYSAGGGITKSFGFEDNRFDVDFHVFAVEWGEEYLRFFVDDVLFQEVKPSDVNGEWVFNKPFYILLNVAVGGSYVGFPTSETPFPQSMLVDYVRVYKEVK